MKVISLCAIHGLKVTKTDEEFEFNDIKLIQASAQLNPEIFTESFFGQAGAINCRTFLNGPYFVRIEDVDSSNQRLLLRNYQVFKNEIRNLLNNLWFIKDNSVNPLGFYSFSPMLETNYYIGTSEGAGNTKADGNMSGEEFSLNDLKSSFYILEAVIKLITENKRREEAFQITFEPVMVSKSPMHFINHNTTNRIERALMFWACARLEKFLPLKISLFMSILESLFSSNESGELSHKMSERVSLYLGGDSEKKNTTYKNVKGAYNVRSKFFHGQRQSSQLSQVESLAAISVKTDSIIRDVLNKVIKGDSAIFLESDDKLNDYFLKLLFG